MSLRTEKRREYEGIARRNARYILSGDYGPLLMRALEWIAQEKKRLGRKRRPRRAGISRRGWRGR
jgi:hypothetical protein